MAKDCVEALMWMLAVSSLTFESSSFMQKNRKTALLQGDILIGALVSVHHQPKKQFVKTLTCGEIREQYGIQRVEAAFMAVDEINRNPDLLPNITLGIEIRDSCWYSSIALEQSLEFIRDALSDSDSCGGSGGHDDSRGFIRPNRTKNIVGVVGPGSSAVTIQVQNLLQLFNIPQVGYSATSLDLSDKSRFSDFLRVVPSDYYQAQVMVDIVHYYNWTYVSTVYTDGNYGQSGMTAFKELAEESNICIAEEEEVLSNAEDHAFDDVIKNLMEAEQANVVICFCEGMTVRNLYRAAQRNNVTSRFLFIGSDGWADRTDVVDGLEEIFIGGISVKIKSPYVKDFDKYYFALRPMQNLRNPWFEEFWQHKFNCSLPVKETLAGLPPCTGDESLSERYYQDTKMSFVMKAVYTMAHGLHNLQRAVCGPVKGICPGMLPINGSQFRNHLMNVTFDFLNETVSFDSSGDPPGRYEIMNFQRLTNGSYGYLRIGTWDNGTLEMQQGTVKFNSLNGLPPTSVCSSPCAAGKAKQSFPETRGQVQTCCWMCHECEDFEYLFNETTCSECQPYYWPNANKTGCDEIEVEHPSWDDDQVIAGLVLAALGFLATVFTMAVFICYNHTPVVKASTRELSYIIFVGMMMSYSSSLAFLAKPSTTSCIVARLLPGLSFSMIYAALVTKTNRIARILAGNKKIMIRKLRFMSALAQVVITLILISVEVVIIVTMFILEPPETVRRQVRDRVMLECNTSTLSITAPLAWDFILVMMCTLYAVKTRNLPENFNEAKFIGFSMYTTCVIWLAWVSIYFGSNHKIICMSVCTSLSALVTLVLLFFPKIYIIVFRPQRNDRSHFKTTTNVRCHFGSGKSMEEMDSNVLMRPPGSFMGVAAILNAGHSLRQPIMTRLKSALHVPASGPNAGRLHPDFVPSTKAALKRELSLWSDASVSGGSSSIKAREVMLQRAYGSQIDLTGESLSPWSCTHVSVQTTDDLLDPLIPRLRRRVARAVRENNLDVAAGREFFSLTQSWVNSQMEAAKAEIKLREEKSSLQPGAAMKTEIVREYLNVNNLEFGEVDTKKSACVQAGLVCNYCKAPTNTANALDLTGSNKNKITDANEENYIQCTYEIPNNDISTLNMKTHQMSEPFNTSQRANINGNDMNKTIFSNHIETGIHNVSKLEPLQTLTENIACDRKIFLPVHAYPQTRNSPFSPRIKLSGCELSELSKEDPTPLRDRLFQSSTLSRTSSLTSTHPLGVASGRQDMISKASSDDSEHLGFNNSYFARKEEKFNNFSFRDEYDKKFHSVSSDQCKVCANRKSRLPYFQYELENIIVSIDHRSERQVRNESTSTNLSSLAGESHEIEQSDTHVWETDFGENCDSKRTESTLSIKDEIDPIPRPERTQLMHSRRRSRKKSTIKSKPYPHPNESGNLTKVGKAKHSSSTSVEISADSSDDLSTETFNSKSHEGYELFIEEDI
ncbi:metabotropic glutamate receptor 1 [Hyalella azteca]|uniref:Metabotropic glutamate receptor 1 n=1 Tax=Hyalella azteca TaxID=294128 RepID=A0A979FT75_HYAAZ|nr:metabotropic glutamate receptor 1 [Hyalella azteca]